MGRTCFKIVTGIGIMGIVSMAAACGDGSAGESHSSGTSGKMRVSYQPANWGGAIYVAKRKGFFKDLGLDVELSVFQSGAPQIAAGASGSWDVGAAGALPSLTGASRYQLQTIGFADEEGKGNVLIADTKFAKKLASSSRAAKGATVVWPANSTGQWVAQTCLKKKFGLSTRDYRAVNLSPGDINNALSSGKYHLAGTFDPFDFLLSAKEPTKVVCTGEDVGIKVTSNLFATKQYAEDHPDKVAKFLAAYLHAIEWKKSHPKEFYRLTGEFYSKNGLKLAPKFVKKSITNRHFIGLSEQRRIFDGGGDSKAARWMTKANGFAKSSGLLKEDVDTASYITDDFIKKVFNNDRLREYASNGKADYGG